MTLRIAPRAEICKTVVHDGGLGIRRNAAVIHTPIPDSVCVVVERILLTFHKLNDKLQEGNPVIFWGGGSQVLHRHTPNALRMIPSRARLRADNETWTHAAGCGGPEDIEKIRQTRQTSLATLETTHGLVFTKDGTQQLNSGMRMGDITEAGNNSVAARTWRVGYDT